MVQLRLGIKIVDFTPIFSITFTDYKFCSIRQKLSYIIEGRTDQRNAQINFSLINLLLFKLLRHVSATQLEPSSGSPKSLQVTSHCNLLGY